MKKLIFNEQKTIELVIWCLLTLYVVLILFFYETAIYHKNTTNIIFGIMIVLALYRMLKYKLFSFKKLIYGLLLASVLLVFAYKVRMHFKNKADLIIRNATK
jgi:hypothetical protein